MIAGGFTPALARTAAGRSIVLEMAICSAARMSAGHAEVTRVTIGTTDDGSGHAGSDGDCCCGPAACPGWAPPPALSFGPATQPLDAAPPALLLAAPRPLHAWAAVRSRGPPAFG